MPSAVRELQHAEGFWLEVAEICLLLQDLHLLLISHLGVWDLIPEESIQFSLLGKVYDSLYPPAGLTLAHGDTTTVSGASVIQLNDVLLEGALWNATQRHLMPNMTSATVYLGSRSAADSNFCNKNFRLLLLCFVWPLPTL